MNPGGYWMVRKIRSGSVVEKSKFFVGERKPRKDRKKGNTSAAKKDRNMNDAVRRLARILNCNMSSSSVMLTLTYDDLPQSAASAVKACQLFLRRFKNAGGLFRGIWITADKDGSQRPKRIHHHLLLAGSGIKIEEDGAYIGGRKIEDLWGKGRVHAKFLQDQQDYTPLADYLVRQAVDSPSKKKWHASEGLKKPQIEEEVVTQKAGELHAPSGAKVLEIGHYDAETGSHYIRYIPQKKEKKILARSDASPDPFFENKWGLHGYDLPPDIRKMAQEILSMKDPSKRSVAAALQILPQGIAVEAEMRIQGGKLFGVSKTQKWEEWLQVLLYYVAYLEGF